MDNTTEDTIILLDDLDKIRQRPGMYIGDNDSTGLHTIIREIIDNAVDEYPNYPDKSKPIEVIVKKDNIVTVRDHGRGISPYKSKEVVGQLEERIAFTRIGAGGKFRENREDTGNIFSGGLNGTGAAGANAMSEYFNVTIYRDGYIFHDEYDYGVPTTELTKNGNLPKKKQDKKETGTEITFKPTKKYMRTTKIDVKRLDYYLERVSFLNPELTIYFTNQRDGEETVSYHSPNGLFDYMEHIAVNEDNEPINMLVKPFQISGEITVDVMGEKNHMKMNILTAFPSGDSFGSEALTNGIENPGGGTHLRGFYIGLRNLLRHYYKEFLTDFTKKYSSQLKLIKRVYKLPNLSEVFSLVQPRDISRRTHVIIDFKHNDPILKPQTKDELVSPEARDAVADIYYKQAMLYLDRDIPAIHEIIGKLIKHLHERAKRSDTRVNLNKEDIKQTVSTKLAAAKGGKSAPKEIFIVEGDSAGGTLKENRDPNYQAVLPLRGKVPNAKRTLFSKLMDNEEIATLTATINTGIGSKYDDSKRMYEKIIIATDQDVDGRHIRVLLVTYLLEYMPELIENGHVYYLDTPLYVNHMKGKEESIYTYSDQEQDKLLEKRSKSIKEIERKKGLGELTKDQVIETILTPETRHLSQLKINDEEALADLVELLMGRDVAGRRKLFTGPKQIEKLSV